MPITLPTNIIQPEAKNPRLSILYGAHKVGKTTICAALEQAAIIKDSPRKYCILELDRDGGGADYIACRKIKCPDFDTVMEACVEIQKAGRPYKVGIVDTGSALEDMAEMDATREYKASNAGKGFKGRSVLELTGPDFNPGYRWLRLSFDKAMGKIISSFDYTIVICHLLDKYIKTHADDKGKTNSEASAKDLDLTNKVKGKLCRRADAIGFMYRTFNADGTDTKLMVDFRTHDFQNCGNSCPHLIQQHFEFSWDKIFLPE